MKSGEGQLRFRAVPVPLLVPQDYQEAVRQMRAAVKTMALAIDQRLTADQRHHAVTKLQRLIDQLHDLHVE